MTRKLTAKKELREQTLFHSSHVLISVNYKKDVILSKSSSRPWNNQSKMTPPAMELTTPAQKKESIQTYFSPRMK